LESKNYHKAGHNYGAHPVCLFFLIAFVAQLLMIPLAAAPLLATADCPSCEEETLLLEYSDLPKYISIGLDDQGRFIFDKAGPLAVVTNPQIIYYNEDTKEKMVRYAAFLKDSNPNFAAINIQDASRILRNINNKSLYKKYNLEIPTIFDMKALLLQDDNYLAFPSGSPFSDPIKHWNYLTNSPFCSVNPLSTGSDKFEYLYNNTEVRIGDNVYVLMGDVRVKKVGKRTEPKKTIDSSLIDLNLSNPFQSCQINSMTVNLYYCTRNNSNIEGTYILWPVARLDETQIAEVIKQYRSQMGDLVSKALP
jgi:hypothetical protein